MNSKLMTFPYNVIVVVIVLAVVYLIYTHFFSSSESFGKYHRDHMYNGHHHSHKREPMRNARRDHLDNTGNLTLGGDTTGTPTSTLYANTQLQPTDLLPDYSNITNISSGSAVTDLLQSQNFIIGSFPQGLDTVSTSKRIPYYDIRNNYPIPKEEYPWNNSPYEDAPGSGRRFFDIGSG